MSATRQQVQGQGASERSSDHVCSRWGAGWEWGQVMARDRERRRRVGESTGGIRA